MFERKSILIIILISLLVISIASAGVFVYQWWQVKNGLAEEQKYRESLIKELMEIKKEAKQETSFVQCREINAHRKDLIQILLLKALEVKPSRNVWNIAVIEPDGFGVGIKDIYLPAPLRETSTMEVQTPIDIDDDGVMDRNIVTIDRKIGDYLIIIRPGFEISPLDTYTLQLRRVLKETFTLAEDIPYTPDILKYIYILRQTETGIIPIIPASVGCKF